jgi:hypothetical protein
MTTPDTRDLARIGLAFVAALAVAFLAVCCGIALRAAHGETDPADGHGYGRQWSDQQPNPSPTDATTCAWWCAQEGMVAVWSARDTPCACVPPPEATYE